MVISCFVHPPCYQMIILFLLHLPIITIFVGLIFVFNLIVGTGALALPFVFSQAGWLLGASVVLILAFISYITVTFVIESIASANAIISWKKVEERKRALQATGDVGHLNSDSEDTPLVAASSDNPDDDGAQHFYAIQEKVEMGEMASMFFNKIGITFFYACLTTYLYGDLSIYGATIAKSVTDVCCTYIPENFSCHDKILDDEPCWDPSGLRRLDAYRIFLTAFVVTLGPFAFFNVQKTKYLQVLTSIMRWLAFTIMIIYATKKLIVDGPLGKPVLANTAGLPSLFGVCVYSFMCHHSLPVLVAMISDKSKLNKSIALDFVLIAVFYLLLALTGVFAFDHLDDIYTLDFGPRNCSTNENFFLILMEYFLALFPVFTLSTNFPVIAITLRNNLQSLFLRNNETYNVCLSKLVFPLLAVIPPYFVALSVENLSVLVSITGAYAGAGIQYLIPTLLVYNARKQTAAVIGRNVTNKFTSPFHHKNWIFFIILWAIVCMSFVTVHLIDQKGKIGSQEYW